MSTAIFFATSTGNTEEIASKISEQLDGIEVFDLSSTGIEKMDEYDNLIIGSSTWGDGELNDDWDEVWSDFQDLDLKNKTIALFGLGDQESYSDEFCSAMGIIYNQVESSGAKIIGFTSSDGYFHDESQAQKGDEFVGLAIDEDNQSDLTDIRIKDWTDKIRSEIL